eukprot:5802454-Pyramimonas_sp.AAC.1
MSNARGHLGESRGLGGWSADPMLGGSGQTRGPATVERFRSGANPSSEGRNVALRCVASTLDQYFPSRPPSDPLRTPGLVQGTSTLHTELAPGNAG